ncbi:ABC transporter substrate-binding protein [Numidum massiliense]|uniref:ABC transporter substrate-binding protein n=1 Tax=Numidum massiliense TaxID=1522315 RepID=UPI0006D531C6|nr:ABC transporter substrate-binding protein [Numidum massiliense]
MKKKALIILTALMLIVGLIGCQAAPDKQASSGSETTKTNDAKTNEEKTDNEKDGNKDGEATADFREIKDMSGRTVKVPAKIEKVFGTSEISTLFLYSLAPDKVAALNRELTADQKKFFDERIHDLPALGSWKGKGGDTNLEEILKAEPDIIINMGDMDERYQSGADEMQEKLGIPVLLIDGSLENLHDAYRYAGDLLDVKERADTLAEYCETAMAKVTDTVKDIPEKDRLPVYYAVGMDGLETAPKGTINTEVLELAGGDNVASTGDKPRGKAVEVSMEQVLKWDPELIVVSPAFDSETNEAYDLILKDDKWKDLKAVKNKLVFEIPNLPFNWFNRPPTINRILGVQWLTNLLYPEQYDIDPAETAQEFFSTFYQVELSDDDIGELLKHAVREK